MGYLRRRGGAVEVVAAASVFDIVDEIAIIVLVTIGLLFPVNPEVPDFVI